MSLLELEFLLKRLKVLSHANWTSRYKIQHKCICPAWADTDIVSSVNNDKYGMVKASIKETGGLMTPEYVAEGFIRCAPLGPL